MIISATPLKEGYSKPYLYVAGVGFVPAPAFGVTRLVVLGKDYVIKIDKPGLDEIDRRAGLCHDEVRVWLGATCEQKQRLAAILDQGDGWLVMARARRDYSEDALELGADELRAWAEPLKVGDVHSDNVGEISGRWVLIDYAGPRY